MDLEKTRRLSGAKLRNDSRAGRGLQRNDGLNVWWDFIYCGGLGGFRFVV